MKLSKIESNSCYDINVTFRSSPKQDFLKLVKLEFRHVSRFSYNWKKMVKFSVKKMTFWNNSLYGQFVCFLLHMTVMAIDNYKRYMVIYYIGQSVWRLSHVLAQFLLTASKTNLDHYHQKVNVRIISRFTEQLKTQGILHCTKNEVFHLGFLQ